LDEYSKGSAKQGSGGENTIKDAVALEIYSKFYDRLATTPLANFIKNGDKYLVVEFRNGRIAGMKIKDREMWRVNIISIPIPKYTENFGKEFYQRIREVIERKNLELDEDFWDLVANAYDWAWM